MTGAANREVGSPLSISRNTCKGKLRMAMNDWRVPVITIHGYDRFSFGDWNSDSVIYESRQWTPTVIGRWAFLNVWPISEPRGTRKELKFMAGEFVYLRGEHIESDKE